MRRMRLFHARLLAVAAVALGGCCETQQSEAVFPVRTDDAGVPVGDGGCESQCDLRYLGCGGDYQVIGCAPEDGGQVRCQYQTTNCPSRSDFGAICGRRPSGYLAAEPAGGASALGELFARMATLERASVPAFERLARELRAHGAPARFVRAAERAARDEVRHGEAMRALAERHGAVPAPFVADVAAVRSLHELARENATEGCVRETFGAVIARVQARAARDPSVRAAMARIAADEARHAALAWHVDAWARTRLDAVEVAEIDAARTDAVRALADEFAVEPPAALRDAAGLPTRVQSTTLLAAATRTFWS